MKTNIIPMQSSEEVLDAMKANYWRMKVARASGDRKKLFALHAEQRRLFGLAMR